MTCQAISNKVYKNILSLFFDQPSEDEFDLVIILHLNIFVIIAAYKFAWNEKTKVCLKESKNFIK